METGFQERLRALDLAFIYRQPDARMNAEYLRDDLKRQMDATAKRLSILLTMRRKSAVWVDSVEKAQAMTAEISSRMKAVDDLLEQHKFRQLKLVVPDEEAGLTPEARLKQPHSKSGRLRRLREASHITHEQWEAGLRIASLFQAMTSALAMQSRWLDGAMGGGTRCRGWSDLRAPEWALDSYSHVYIPWTRRCVRERIPPDMVIDLCVWDVSVDTLRRSAGWGWDRALRCIRWGLDIYLEEESRYEVESSTSQTGGTPSVSV